jgi:hypothetical protein
MILTRTLTITCILASLACLMSGFAAAGYWMAASAALAPALIMLLARKFPSSWLPTTSLILSVCLAAIGILSGARPFLLAWGSIAALASWDLALLENSLEAGHPQHSSLFESSHLKSLALAIGLGLVVVSVGSTIRLSLPFGVLVLLVILILICLDRLIDTQIHQG